MAGYCDCSHRHWDIWVSDRKRAFCRSCGRDVSPAAARREYAIANAELERVRAELMNQLEEGVA